MKFSVIIAVYNAPSEYLSECIDSVLNQEYNEIEIIIIDDGSTKQETLDELGRYRDIKNLNGKELILREKQNGGQGSARNAGLTLATGEYVLFLDSDDYYMSAGFIGDIAKLLSESNADVLSFQYKEFFNDLKRPHFLTGSLPRNEVFGQSKDKAIKALLKSPRCVFSSATHTKAIKLRFLKENNIIAAEGISNEDVSLTAAVIFYAKTYDRYNKIVYAYRRTNMDSISTRVENNLKIARDVLMQFEDILVNKEYGADKNVLDFLASPYVYWMAKMAGASAQIDNAGKDEYTDCINKGTGYSYILKHSSRPYIRLLGIPVKMFGVRFTISLLYVFLSLKRRHMLSINRKIE